MTIKSVRGKKRPTASRTQTSRKGTQLETVKIGDDILGPLGTIQIRQPTGTYGLTPASRIGMTAVTSHRQHLFGVGLDWGCGTGCMALTAAKIPTVRKMIGLDIEPANIEAATGNAISNGLFDRATFFHADSYIPFAKSERSELADYTGRIDFIVANPPATNEGDGFGWRREVLRGGAAYLKPRGRVLLNISIQYAASRIEGLCDDVPGYEYHGLVASTDWVPFDMSRADLGKQVVEYADEEGRGGADYYFCDPTSAEEKTINARQALKIYRATGLSPLSKWQNYLFIRL